MKRGVAEQLFYCCEDFEGEKERNSTISTIEEDPSLLVESDLKSKQIKQQVSALSHAHYMATSVLLPASFSLSLFSF